MRFKKLKPNDILAIQLIVGIPLGLLAIICFLVSTLFSGMCANTISQEVISPDGQLKAVVFQRDCGATTGFSSQVSILYKWETLPNDSGNVYVQGYGGVEVNWESPTVLCIKHGAKAEVFDQQKSFQRLPFTPKIEIKYLEQ